MQLFVEQFPSKTESNKFFNEDDSLSETVQSVLLIFYVFS